MSSSRCGLGMIEQPAMRRRRSSAFTLIELLVVIAIIALLVTLLIPALQEAKRHARVVMCATNMRAFAMGMATYSAEDDRNEYPQNTGWSVDFVWTEGYEYPADKHAFLDQWLELVCGGNGEVLWCALDRDLRPGPKSPFLGDSAMDPRYGDIFTWYHGAGHWEAYAIGYVRLAAWTYAGAVDWRYSGNTDPEGRPAMRPNTSRDIILCDWIMSDDVSNFGYIDNHADDPRDWTTHRDNCAGYSDCHVEIHEKEFTSVYPSPRWEEHRLKAGVTFLLW